MRFPNLLWAIENSRLRHYEFAIRVGIDASRFSRCMRGRFKFAPLERSTIATALGYPEKWLFQVPTPPARKDSAGLAHVGVRTGGEHIDTNASANG